VVVLNLPADCRSHSGADPVYYSTRLQRSIPVIQSLTRVDDDSARYYRVSSHEGWRRLKTVEDYARLNKAIEAHLNAKELA
jgi:hypothetical protein